MVADDQGRQCESGERAGPSTSSRRRPGPIATAVACSQIVEPIAPYVGHGVWVPAFAGTTQHYCDGIVCAGAALLSCVTTRSPLLAANAVPASSNRA